MCYIIYMSISVPNQKIVWAQCAGKCAICKTELIEAITGNSLVLVGEMAHIEGEKPGAKRYNPGQSELERGSCENLILLCPTHHTLIDRDDIKYTVKLLKEIKAEHNAFISKSIKAELTNITFAELQVIVSYLVSPNIPFDVKDSLDHIAPKEKIDKNNLSSENAGLIAIGMTKVKQVKNYLNSNPDVNFSERLRTRLVICYNNEKSNESDSNVVFSSLLSYMSEGSRDFKKIASALAVLTYFFETCDIFEK